MRGEQEVSTQEQVRLLLQNTTGATYPYSEYI